MFFLAIPPPPYHIRHEKFLNATPFKIIVQDLPSRQSQRVLNKHSHDCFYFKSKSEFDWEAKGGGGGWGWK